MGGLGENQGVSLYSLFSLGLVDPLVSSVPKPSLAALASASALALAEASSSSEGMVSSTLGGGVPLA